MEAEYTIEMRAKDYMKALEPNGPKGAISRYITAHNEVVKAMEAHPEAISQPRNRREQ